jgi:glycosyltransferase involved in cell wall biosynthesis
VHVIAQSVNRGAGEARNVGIRYAATRESPFVLFLDADDLARPDRLASVRDAFTGPTEPGVVYSTFDVVDPDGRTVPLDEMTGSIAEVIEAHRRGPPEGSEVWIPIGTETGYVNHTSSTAVRTDVALAHPFPVERVSEDAHTWFRYSAGGARFAYLDAALSAYRTTADAAGSSSRSREGGKRGFYASKARVDADGFRCAIDLALTRGVIEPGDIADLWVGFRVRLAATLAREGRFLAALEQLAAARSISVEGADRRLRDQGWDDVMWEREATLEDEATSVEPR